MNAGTIIVGAPSQNQASPSTASFIIGSPSPTNNSLTQSVQTGSSGFATSFGSFIQGLTKTATGAITGIGNQIKYKGDIIKGTVQKEYYQAVSGVYGAIGSTAQGASKVAETVKSAAGVTTLVLALAIGIPLFLALRKK